MTTARRVAVDVLFRARTASAWAAELVDDALRATPELTHPDRRLVTQLVFGVIRRQATLDALIRPFVTRPYHAVEPVLIDVLRLGAYQLAFLTAIPKHAAVHESVELARHVGSPSATGFINGVLRKLAAAVTDDYVDEPASDAVPVDQLTSGSAARYRKLTTPLLPDPATDGPGYIAAGFSWPYWLADQWFHRHGFAETARLGAWFNAPPPLWLRVNSWTTNREAYRLQLAAATIGAEPGPEPHSLKLLDPVPVRDLPGYAAGDFSVQDLSAQAVAAALAPEPGWHVLDLCSAPGGKTTHLAELMRNRGRIVACDVDPHRLQTVANLCQRLRVTIVEPYLMDKHGTIPPDGRFDAALIDVPCSNTGVLGRRPEVRWRLRPRDFEDLIRMQTRLLFAAIERVKPGGVIVYSTCSIEPDENGGVVRGVCRAIRGLKLEAEAIAIPGQPADGGYWARLRMPR